MTAVGTLRCNQVGALLVAFQDGELPPAELTLVARHLDSCPGCAGRERALDGVTPRPTLIVRPRIVEELQRRVDDAVEREWARQSAEADLERPDVWVWLARERRIRTGWLVVAAVVLVAAVAAGVAGWRLPGPTRSDVADMPSPTTLSSEQYRPASYSR